MTATFSTNESASLERVVEINASDIKEIDEIWNPARLDECLKWVHRNDFKKVCLQFPDELICFSTKIAQELRESLLSSAVSVYILGDTSYGSCCVDEIAAAHISADAIIHFGSACLSKITRLPVHYVFPNYPIDCKAIAAELKSTFSNGEQIVIFYNVGYYYSLDELKNELSLEKNISFGKLSIDSEPDTLCWTLDDDKDLSKKTCIYLGQDDQTLFNLTMSLSAKTWYKYDPKSDPSHRFQPINPLTSSFMRRRYFYVEKCKDAQSIGIVVGTLAAKGYLQLVKHIQSLARAHGKRTYLLSVGKVNPAKLANFQEIDCFVLIACPENNLYTSRDFYKPLLSVFDVEIALNPAWHSELPATYCTDFRELLAGGKLHRDFVDKEIGMESDVSLVTGKIRRPPMNNDFEDPSNNLGTLVEKKNHELMLSDSTGAFQNRSWTGLDPALGQNEPAKVKDGRSGLAIRYSAEDN